MKIIFETKEEQIRNIISREIDNLKKELTKTIGWTQNIVFDNSKKSLDNTIGVNENSGGIFDIADLSDENSTGIFDLADMLAELDERVTALEEK